MSIKRRSFLLGSASLLAAPAILSASGRNVSRAGIESTRERWLGQGVIPDADGVLRLRATLNYRTDPERTRQLLPPMFDVDPKAEVQFNALNSVGPVDSGNILAPGPDYGEVDISVTCYYQGVRYFTSLPWLLSRDFGRYAGREGAMIRKKDAWIDMDIADGVINVEVLRRDKLVAAFRAVPTSEPAFPAHWFRDMANGELRFDYRLHADWRKSLFADEPIELWRHFGSEQGEAIGMPDFSSIDAPPPRALDLNRSRLEFIDASPLDPYIELPVVEMLGGSITTHPRGWAASVPVPRERGMGTSGRYGTPEKRVKLAEVSAQTMAAFAFSAKAYDPPVFEGKVQLSEKRWPRRGTMVQVAQATIDAYQAREYMSETGEFLIADFQLDTGRHKNLLPPRATAITNPAIRLIAGKVGVSDLTTVPYAEAWLLANMNFEGKTMWFALSHLVEAGGDVITGRETWGYPTKQADRFIFASDADQVTVGIIRLHREVVNLTTSLDRSLPIGAAEIDMDLLGIQSLGISDARTRGARYVGQPWRLAMNSVREADPAAFRFSPSAHASPAGIGLSDAWHEFADLKAARIQFGKGTVMRYPGRYLSEKLTSELGAYTRDRNDGGGGRNVKTTFLITRD